MKKTITLFVALLLVMGIDAKDRTEAEMMRIAAGVLGDAPATRGTQAELRRLVSSDMLGIYGAGSRGFVVVSRDDAFAPVLGYSDTEYSEAGMPCGFRWWLDTAEKSMKRMKATGQTPAVQSYATADNEYFIETKWDQNAPYNTLCPKINGSAAPTGCVATAMAQIMYYYRYPAAGKGSGGYYVIDAKNNETKYEAQINSTYDWNNMKTTYLRPVDTNNAVATLMADAGAAVYMQYASAVSGAYDMDAARGFAENFSYDPYALHWYNRMFYSDEEWMGFIRTELEAKRPILYSGSDEVDGGHAFVLDGIDADGKVHVNWGWSGSGNGWYSIDVLKPENQYAGGALTNGPGFNEYQSMVFGFKPQPTPDAGEEPNSLWGTSGYSFFVQDNRLRVKCVDAFNYSFRDFSGQLAFIVEGTDKMFLEYDSEKEGVLKAGYGFYFDESEDYVDLDLSDDLNSFAPGTYRIYMASKSTEESSWQPVRSIGGLQIYELTVANNGTMTVSEWQGSSTGISQAVTGDASASGMVTVFDTAGRRVYSAPAASFRESDIPAKGVLIVKSGNRARKIVR